MAMAWFVAKYRKPDCVMTEAEFDATDKFALLKLLAEENVSAGSIVSGRSSKKSTSHLLHGLVMGVIFIAVAVVAWMFYFYCDGKTLADSSIKLDDDVANETARNGDSANGEPALHVAIVFSETEFGAEVSVERIDEKIPNTRIPYHVTFLLRGDVSKRVAELVA